MSTPTAARFRVLDIAPEPYALTPVLSARIRVTNTGGDPVHAIALRCQVRIEPSRRRYRDDEADGLLDLFGRREQWGQTQRSFLWQHASTMVPGFTETTETTVPLVCTYDFEVAAAKYLHALRDGTVPLQFLFNGTIFHRGERGFSVQQVAWDCDDRFDMPVTVWTDLVAQQYPDSGWVRLRHDSIAALATYRSERGLLDLDDAVTALLGNTRQGVGS
ncbi:DUF6084 family protein [Mycolicibacterium palauense]|uniref:DUF6084 family protein n=1 Tax=Mycolicibacterium palauense TaxID=2034511 RepID=UPI000BFEDF36|nr:DUF6084 family protein [Mycolicibacterium palauense]